MADIPFRKILGFNQQTYRRLRLSLTLHLRRQVFVAVCDDLTLRDRMANQLAQDLNAPTSGASQPYPRLVTLHLNLNDPNPMAQIAQWVSESPPPKRGGRRVPLPTFQFVGIEHLTRQSAAVQRLFFANLQGIERHLAVLESGLLIWLPKPWFHALPQSAPEFWQCRTGIFEFIGDPTPTLNGLESDADAGATPPVQERSPDDSQEGPRTTLQDPPPSLVSSLEVEELDSESEPDDLWTILTHDLAQLDQRGGTLSDPASDDRSNSLESRLQMIKTATPASAATPVGRAAPVLVTARPAGATRPTAAPPTTSPKGHPHRNSDNGHSHGHNSNGNGSGSGGGGGNNGNRQGSPAATAASSKAPSESAVTPPALAHLPGIGGSDRPDDPSVTLLQQIEQLHQKHAPPSAYADAYRALGNCYRDRIEAGDATLQNLQVAIHAYEQVLVWLHETSPLWIDVLNDLGNLYWMLSRITPVTDDALGYLQQSIQAYQLALAKVSPETPSHAYPMLQNNLGSAYADLARYQTPVENLQRAIQAYQQTLHFRKPDVEPLKYASTQNNLGTAYWSLAQHQQPEVYLKQAIAAYSEALQYYNPTTDALSYAMIQNNLGTAYWNLAQRERPLDWLRLAVGAYRSALKYRTMDETPAPYAATQNNLGTAYLHLANQSKDDPTVRSEYLHQAINAYEATLVAIEEVMRRSQASSLTFDLFATHNNLGLARYQVVTDIHTPISGDLQQPYLEVALHHHVLALDGWQQKPDLRKTAFACILQTIRALYQSCGLEGQNLALSKVPGHLLPELLTHL